MLVKYSFLWQKRFGIINKFGMDFDMIGIDMKV